MRRAALALALALAAAAAAAAASASASRRRHLRIFAALTMIGCRHPRRADEWDAD